MHSYTQLAVATFQYLVCCSFVIIFRFHCVVPQYCIDVGSDRVVFASPAISCKSAQYQRWVGFVWFIFFVECAC